MSDAAAAEQLTAAAGGDRLLATQLQLARIEGMLTTVLQGHEVRFATIEASQAVHERRLNDKGKLLARHDERLSDLEDRQQAVETDRGPKASRNIATVGLLIALPGFAIALINFFRLSGGLP